MSECPLEDGGQALRWLADSNTGPAEENSRWGVMNASSSELVPLEKKQFEEKTPTAAPKAAYPEATTAKVLADMTRVQLFILLEPC